MSKPSIGAILVLLGLLVPGNIYGAQADDDGRDRGRSFVFKELVLSGLYAPSGVVGVPPSDASEDHFEASPRPPGNYVGVEYVRTFTEASWANESLLPAWLELTAMNLHPRLVFDITERNGGIDRFKLAPQDFWVRFRLAGVDRLTLRLGQFVLPYGANPVLAPRQQFVLPVEASDLGLKWDWGIALKGPLAEYEWEVAATIGSGEGLRSPHWFDGEPSTFLLSGRVGTPTYWDVQYGVSFLYGDLPTVRAANVVDDTPVRRWRIAFDTVYKSGTYLMLGAQVSIGQDRSERRPGAAFDPSDRAADVLGYRAWLDWVVPGYQNWRLGVQLESVVRDLARSRSDDTAAIFEVGYSLSTPITLKLDYRREIHRARANATDGVFVSLVYYSS